MIITSFERIIHFVDWIIKRTFIKWLTSEFPDSYIPGFKAINTLSIEDIKKIAVFIREIPIGITGKPFIELLINNLPIKGIDDVADTLLSFGNVLTNSTVEDVSNGLAHAYTKFPDNVLSEEEEHLLSQKIHLLIENLENFKLTFRAIDLLSETDNVFIESRILTDIRPVFEKYSQELEGNALIVHQLRIEYVSNNENKKFFFSLDLNDLKKLKENIDRAIGKQSQIEEKYKLITNFIDITT